MKSIPQLPAAVFQVCQIYSVAFFSFCISIALLYLWLYSFFTERDSGRQHAFKWQLSHKAYILFQCLLNDRISCVIFLWSLTITHVLMTSSNLLSHGNLIAALRFFTPLLPGSAIITSFLQSFHSFSHSLLINVLTSVFVPREIPKGTQPSFRSNCLNMCLVWQSPLTCLHNKN